MSDALPKSMVTTGILAIGRVTGEGAGEARSAIMPREVRETVALHLQGHIGQWFSLTAEVGVVFVLNLTDVEEAEALLGSLPLAKAGMMTFDLLPVGPLKPLTMLLAD